MPEKEECEACGDNVYDEMYQVICTDGAEFEACNICLISYFTEIPNEIVSVKKLNPTLGDGIPSDARFPATDEGKPNIWYDKKGGFYGVTMIPKEETKETK